MHTNKRRFMLTKKINKQSNMNIFNFKVGIYINSCKYQMLGQNKFTCSFKRNSAFVLQTRSMFAYFPHMQMSYTR